ncbi:zona pellucida domain protein papillote [Musca autumnalis]|uniref:zona pellucida domain protein papillote n=1 Tax=Musca autumnalis TaxID=221902 RepID=UPI003CF0C820
MNECCSIKLRPMLALLVILLSSLQFSYVTAQSNYVQHGDSGNYTTNGLPEEATLDGKVTKLDDISPLIFLNRTKAALNCAAGSMQVDMKFNEPFHGIIQADYDRSSACRVNGKGALSYRLELPLKGCGTIQNPTRVFTNNIIVRFHANLEMDGDEIITIVCRYPPPVPSLPPALPAPILNPVDKAAVVHPPLKGIQILMIICAIMFLTLLLLGLAVSYYCLRSRPIPVVRRLPMSMGSGSEITKLSGSSMGGIGEFEGVKIPRAHAPLAAVHSSSGSEGALIPSDYPSESHSEIEEIDTRSLPVSSAGSFENRAFVQETSSIYSDHYGHTQELQAANAIATAIPRHPIAVKEASSPKFDVQVRVKKSPPPPPSPQTSDTESVATLRPDRNNLSTIMESHEDRESVTTMESLPGHEETMQTQFTYTPDIHTAPQHTEITLPPPVQPVFSVYTRTHHEMVDGRPETWSDYTDGPALSEITDVTSRAPDLHSVAEMVDSSHFVETEYIPPEPPIVIKKPQITSHTVDDVYLRTITEKKTIEDIESHKRKVTEYKAKPKPLAPPVPDPKWDVKIRNYPTEREQQQWENFSDISSVSGLTLTPKMERSELSLPPVRPTEPPQQIYDNKEKLTSPQLVGNMKPIELPPEDKAVPNWDVLIRILEEPEMSEADDASSVHSSVHALSRYISYDDKAKWKEIITTESSLRTMLTEAVVKEDFERIRSDTRYERIFEPQTWDVIIRILAPPSDDEGDVEMRTPRRNKKTQPWDTRSRRSSLPTLYEYDSDGGSSVRTIRNDPSMPIHPNAFNLQRSRRSSRTSYNTDHNDFRSMSEVTVDFGRMDNMSNASSYYPMQYDDDDNISERRSFHRSVSHPSLARSASEFTEHWGVPDDMSSPEGTPTATRSQRMVTTFQSRVPAPPPPPRSGRMVAQTQHEYVETRRTSSSYRTEAQPRPREW